VPPETAVLFGLLRAVRARLRARALALGVAAGLAVAAAAGLFGWPGSRGGLTAAGILLGLAGAAVSILISHRRTPSAAARIEEQLPASRNLVLTASELATMPAVGRVHSLVLHQAVELVRDVEPSALVPLSGATLALFVTTAWWGLEIARGGQPLVPVTAVAAIASPGPTILGVDARVQPPEYAGRAPQMLRDPSRVEALVGSRLTLTIDARARALVVETATRRDTVARRGRAAFTIVIPVDGDGFISLEPLDSTRTGARRLIGLSAIVDAPPRVRITAPGKDIVLGDGNASLDVAIESDDDIGLASLALRYTKVSGSGERFTFAEGTAPIQITRTDARHWTASAHWSLRGLELGPGDMVVYRAVAADVRPQAPAVESDAYIAEVASPGGVAAPGFSLDPEQEKYAVSQQMVILKTERLVAKRATLSAEEYATQSAELAAEQRKVRSEFVFMLGGELADAPDVSASMTELNEEQEAESEQDILAGRNANAGHVALLRAIRAMSRAAASLTTAQPDSALPHERIALTSLEAAFSRARIILRALTTRERLDPTRRLTGTLSDAMTSARPADNSVIEARTAALRIALRDLAVVANQPMDARTAAGLSAIALRVLQIDPSAKPLQDAAAKLDGAARDATASRSREARAAIDTAATAIASVARASLPIAPSTAPPIEDAVTAGGFADALRGRHP
jgi:hypothetical protein